MYTYIFILRYSIIGIAYVEIVILLPFQIYVIQKRNWQRWASKAMKRR